MKRTMATKMIVLSNELRTRGSMPGAIRSEIITRSSAWAAMHHLQKSRYAGEFPTKGRGPATALREARRARGSTRARPARPANALPLPELPAHRGPERRELRSDSRPSRRRRTPPRGRARAPARTRARGPMRPRMGRAARDPQREAAEPFARRLQVPARARRFDHERGLDSLRRQLQQRPAGRAAFLLVGGEEDAKRPAVVAGPADSLDHHDEPCLHVVGTRPEGRSALDAEWHL